MGGTSVVRSVCVRILFNRALTSIAGALGSLASLLPAKAVTNDTRPVSRILTETAPDFGLSIRQIDATNTGANLTLDDAAFDGVVLWLDTLEGEHGLTIASLQITRLPQVGQVAATMSLKVEP